MTKSTIRFKGEAANDHEIRDKARKRRIKDAIARALDKRATYLKNQGKRSNRLLQSL